MNQLWIVQPYVPSYRVPFFEGLAASLKQFDIKLNVVAGQPRGAQAQRGDAQSPAWLTQTHDLQLRVGRRTLTFTSTRKHWRTTDAVIVPHMGSSLDALTALISKSQMRVGVWGHIASYTSKPNLLDAAIERWELRRADRIFAYTQGGANYAISAGIPEQRITVVMNSTATSKLTRDLTALTPDELRNYRQEHSIPSDVPRVAYLGSLDESKRIDLLAQALDVLYARGSRVHLVVGGAGNEQWRLRDAARRSQVTMLGRADGRLKALLLADSRVLINPGRIGLVSVEALAAGIPLLTTDYPFHAPEVEYLTEGSTMFSSPADPTQFANLIEAHISDPPHATPNWHPTLANMVKNFSVGATDLVLGEL